MTNLGFQYEEHRFLPYINNFLAFERGRFLKVQLVGSRDYKKKAGGGRGRGDMSKKVVEGDQFFFGMAHISKANFKLI